MFGYGVYDGGSGDNDYDDNGEKTFSMSDFYTCINCVPGHRPLQENTMNRKQQMLK